MSQRMEWRRLGVLDRIRWGLRRMVRLDSHCVLSLPIFVVLVFVFVVEFCIYCAIKLSVKFFEEAYFLCVTKVLVGRPWCVVARQRLFGLSSKKGCFPNAGTRKSRTRAVDVDRCRRSSPQLAPTSACSPASSFSQSRSTSVDENLLLFDRSTVLRSGNEEAVDGLLSVRGWKKRMYTYTSYDKYRVCVEALDNLTGRTEWKDKLRSSSYDYETVARRKQLLQYRRLSGDVEGVLVILKSCLHGQFGGIFREQLYSRTYCGTKRLIEEFVDEVCISLDFLHKYVDSHGPLVRNVLHHVSGQWGCSALILSGGGMLGMHHFGFCETLLNTTSQRRSRTISFAPGQAATESAETANPLSRSGEEICASSSRRKTVVIDSNAKTTSATTTTTTASSSTSSGDGLDKKCAVLRCPLPSSPYYNKWKDNVLPNVICGTSAGAVVATWLCTRTEEELARELNSDYISKSFAAFSPNNWFVRGWNILRRGYMCDINTWVKSAYRLYGDMTFLEAYQKTGKVLNICMTRADSNTDEDGGAPLLLNYKNAPNVVLYSAVICSASVPFFCCPLHLKEKTKDGQLVESTEFEGSFYHDGSLSGDIPINLLRDMWGVTFTIVSQVNPHIFPFSGLRAHGEPGMPVAWRGRAGRWRAGFIMSGLELLFKENMRFLLRLVALLDVSPTYRGINCGSLALQSYTGDVTVHPLSLSWLHRKFSNDLTAEEVDWFIQQGRAMAYPKMSLILNRMRIERALERIHLASFEHLFASGRGALEAPLIAVSPSLAGMSAINPYSVVEQRTFRHINQLYCFSEPSSLISGPVAMRGGSAGEVMQNGI